jgi:hypothetical protein
MGQVFMGQVVHGASCPWGQLFMGLNDYGAKCHGENFDGASCPGSLFSPWDDPPPPVDRIQSLCERRQDYDISTHCYVNIIFKRSNKSGEDIEDSSSSNIS